DVLRQFDRQVALRHRHDAAALAMDDRNGAAPIALARNAPVAQAEVDFALGNRAAGAGRLFEPARDLLLRRLAGHAVEETRIDQAPVAFVSLVNDDEGLRVLSRRAYNRRIAETVSVDEVEIALIVRRAAEDRTGAVLHQDAVGDIDRKLPVGIGWVNRLHPAVEAALLGRLDH